MLLWACCSVADRLVFVPAGRLRFAISSLRFVTCSVAPWTITSKLPLAVLPAWSVAVHVTVVVPMGKGLPEAGSQLTTGGMGSVSSVAVTSKATCAPSAVVALTVMGLGRLSVGGVSSPEVGCQEG